MKVEVKFTRLGCLWNFVEALTLWHFSFSKRDVENWLNWTGPLSPREKDALKKLTKISKKYSSGKKEEKGSSWKLDQAFIAHGESTAWKEVKKLLRPSEFKAVETALSLLERRFAKLWSDEEIRLRKRQKVLQKGFSKRDPEKIVAILRNFFAPDEEPKKVEIFLLLNTDPQSVQGGANLGEGQITLHCSHTEPRDDGRFPITTIWHEIAHLFQQSRSARLEGEFVKRIQKPKFWPKKTFKKGNIIREAVVAAIVSPDGYLDHLFYSMLDEGLVKRYGKRWQQLDPKSRSDWVNYAGYGLYPVAIKYVRQKRPIDREFMEELLEVWENYVALCRRNLRK